MSGGRDGEAERGLEKVNRELPPSGWKVGGGEKKQLTYSTSDLSVQGYPTITPRIPFPFFPHNVQPRPISDFLVHRFVPIQSFLFTGRHLRSIIYLVMVSSISRLFDLLFIYLLSSRHVVIGTYKFSLRFCWLHYTYIQSRLPLTLKYFSAIKALLSILPSPLLLSPLIVGFSYCCV